MGARMLNRVLWEDGLFHKTQRQIQDPLVVLETDL